MIEANSESQICQTIKSFILRSVNLANIQDDDPLFDSGLVNSLLAIQLMTFLEKTFHIEVGPDDLELDNFKSVRAAAAFVVRKRACLAA